MPIPPPTRPRSRRVRRLAVCGLAVIALPVAGCGSDSGSSKGTPAAAVPATAPVYGEVTVRPEGDMKASIVALSKKIAGTDDPGGEIIKAIERSGDPSDRSTFEDDVDPWLGKQVGAAITGVRDPRSPDYIFVIDSTDNAKAAASFKKDEKKAQDRTYKGVKYAINDAGDAGGGLGDHFVFGTEPGFKAAVDADKSGKTLDKSDKLQTARKSVTDQNLGFFYADPTGIIDLVAAASPALRGQVGQLKSLLGGEKVSALGAALTAAPDAIRLEAAADGQTSKTNYDDAAKTLAALPTDSLVALGLGSIGDAGRQAVKQFEKLGGVYGAGLGQFKAVTGLDLQQDVLSWMGQGGLFVRAKGLADIGGALVVDTSDEKKSATFITTARGFIDRFLRGGGIRTATYSAGGVKGFQVRIPSFPFPVIAATGAGKFVVAVGEGSVKEAIKPTTKLADDPQFKQTTAKLDAKPALYVDLKSALALVDLGARSDPSYQKARRYLQAFTALAAGAKRSGDTTKSNLVVTVK